MGDSIFNLPVPTSLGSMCLWVCVCVQLLSTLCDPPPPTRLSCPWNWSGLPFPTPGDLLDSGIKSVSLASPALTGRFFTNSITWEDLNGGYWMLICNPGTSCISLHSYQKSVSLMFYKWRYGNLERSSDFYIPIQQGKWLPRWLSGKIFTCQCRRTKRHRFNLWIGKILWSRKWHSTSVFLPGKFHG